MIAGALWLAVEPCAAVISGPAMLIRLARGRGTRHHDVAPGLGLIVLKPGS